MLYKPDDKLHLTMGRGQVVNPDGSVAWEEDWQLNTLANEGEEQVLEVFLRESANPTKYLALLTSAPNELTTMTDMAELGPGIGYARVQVDAVDWGAPSLDSGDFKSTAAQKSFGPAAVSSWNITHVALVTTLSGTAGKFLIYVPLSGPTTVNVGQSFLYTITVKAQ